MKHTIPRLYDARGKLTFTSYSVLRHGDKKYIIYPTHILLTDLDNNILQELTTTEFKIRQANNTL